jgi:hypothetical protein
MGLQAVTASELQVITTKKYERSQGINCRHFSTKAPFLYRSSPVDATGFSCSWVGDCYFPPSIGGLRVSALHRSCRALAQGLRAASGGYKSTTKSFNRRSGLISMRKQSTKVVSSRVRTGPVGRFGASSCLTPHSLVPVVRNSRDSILFCFWQLSRARRDNHSVSDMLSYHAVALFPLSELAP